MKKKLVKVLALVLIGSAVVGMTGCKILVQKPSQEVDVCYYGCPNSKKVKKLNTRKRKG